MLGKYDIKIKTNRLQYEFSIKRNITIICGESGTGKTTLVDLIDAYYNLGVQSGVTLTCDVDCATIQSRNWEILLSSVITNSIIFIDEGFSYIFSKDFAEIAKKSNNYFVFITRQPIHELPYSVEEIYEIRTSGRYHTLRPIKPPEPHHFTLYPKVLIIEDSNSGYEFFCNLVTKYFTDIKCISAQGKSNIKKLLSKIDLVKTKVGVIVDGAAFGADYLELNEMSKIYPNLTILTPESFEYLLLKFCNFNISSIYNKLNETYNYADSIKYFSWERFYTNLLQISTNGTIAEYNKNRLNPYYLSDRLFSSVKDYLGLQFNNKQETHKFS